MSCSICLQNYNTQACKPIVIDPCGHGLCEKCFLDYNNNSNNNNNNQNQINNKSCPECRKQITSVIPNRSLIDYLNSQNLPQIPQIPPIPPQVNNSIFKTEINSHYSRNYREEILRDKCEYTFIVIDNSGSMQNQDGKKFYLNEKSEIEKLEYITRWEEAIVKTIQIANYNIARNIIATYYLLNPKKKDIWQIDIDCVTINPNLDNCYQKLEILEKTLLHYTNIRGTTPLDKITNQFRIYLENLLEDVPISYNLITDGEPNNKITFEATLKNLCKDYQIFMVINLCTDNENIINYYNELDKSIGNEICGLDVIDDLEGELQEIKNVGNDWFVYSFQLHLCRMSGCYSIIADLMDEGKYTKPQVLQLVKELLKIKNNDNLDNNIKNPTIYLGEIAECLKSQPRVFNFTTKKMEPPIDILKLKYTLYSNKLSCLVS